MNWLGGLIAIVFVLAYWLGIIGLIGFGLSWLFG